MARMATKAKAGAASDIRGEDREAIAVRASLMAARSAFETAWEEARRHFQPEAQTFSGAKESMGERDRTSIVDTHGWIECDRLADFLFGELADPQKDGFHLTDRGIIRLRSIMAFDTGHRRTGQTLPQHKQSNAGEQNHAAPQPAV